MGHLGKNLINVIHNEFLIILEFVLDSRFFLDQGSGDAAKRLLVYEREEMISDCLMILIGFVSALANKDPNQPQPEKLQPRKRNQQ